MNENDEMESKEGQKKYKLNEMITLRKKSLINDHPKRKY